MMHVYKIPMTMSFDISLSDSSYEGLYKNLPNTMLLIHLFVHLHTSEPVGHHAI